MRCSTPTIDLCIKVRQNREKQSNTHNAVSHHLILAIIPAYNEERFIGSVVLQAYKHVDIVIVVDDGSTDATADIAKAAGAVVIEHERNTGKGSALNSAFIAARDFNPDVVVMLDADGQHLPDELTLVTKPVLAGEVDIVVGSRYLEETSKVPKHRIWGHRAFNFITNLLSGVALTDTQSGFRAFSRRALHTITFQSKSFSVESEIQFLADDYDLKIAEVPITIEYLDAPKRSVVAHGLIVLNGILHLVGQYRPLLFFGLLGGILLLFGLSLGSWVVHIYRHVQTVAIGYAMLSVLFINLGALIFFTGVILHSVRGLLLAFSSNQHNFVDES